MEVRMDVLEAIRQRRSINFFEPGREIAEEKLTGLLDISNLSPSSFNVQPWRVVVVKDPERKKVLRKCAFDQPKVEEASAVLIIVADPAFLEKNFDRVLDSWEKLGYIPAEKRETLKEMTSQLHGEPDSIKRKLSAVKNASLYAMTLMIAAKGLGLDTHAMDGFDEDCVRKEFGIPQDMLIPMLIAVGYLKSGVKLLPRAFRRPLEEFVSRDNYSQGG